MAVYSGIEKYIFSDAYNFFLKYKDMPNDDYHWDACIKDAGMLGFKYKNHPMMRTILNGVMNQLEHIVCDKAINDMDREQWEENLKVAHKIGW